MKKILFILLLFPALAFGQCCTYILKDSLVLMGYGNARSEFVARNSTKDTVNGVLTNTGNGVTAFKKLRLQKIDDTSFVLKVGTVNMSDTVRIPVTGSGGGGANTDTQRISVKALQTGFFQLCITRQGGEICLPFKYSVDSIFAINDSIIATKTDGQRWGFPFPADDSIYVFRTYTDLYNEWQANGLVEGRKYHITDHRQIYDQSISDVTKTAALEPLVLTASSNSTFSPIAYSTLFPNDYIEYDISVDTTYVNAAAARGKITYRKDPNGNSAPFDFRHVLMYRASDASEALIYDLTLPQTSVNDLSVPGEFMIAVVTMEYPGSIFSGATFHNTNILPIASYFEGGFSQNTRGYFESSVFSGAVTQTSNVNFSSTTVAGDVEEINTLTISECTFAGNLNTSSIGTWASSTFAGSHVKEATKCGFNGTYVGGLIDRIHSCTSSGDSIYGVYYWSNNVFSGGSVVRGDIRGVNNIVIDTTESNCHLKSITGVSSADGRIGFDNCEIVGTSGSSNFGNITITCLIPAKTIDEATYPELFDLTFHKTIYAKPDGTIAYWWLDNADGIQITDIP